MVTIKFVSTDDWQGIYIHNNLVIQSHSIDALTAALSISDYITIYIGYNFNRFIIEEYEVSSEWLEVYGELPIRFDEIPNDVIKKIEIER